MKSHDLPSLPPRAGVFRLRAAAIIDPCARAPREGPVELLIEAGEARACGAAPVRALRVLASGAAAQIDAHPAAAISDPIDLGDAVLLPAMVNAHTHLDLTHLGPLTHEPGEGFVAWVDRVRAGRADTPEAIAASVARGVELSLRAGVVTVGDIAGAPRGVPRLEPFEALAASEVGGVSFLEFFAMGRGEAAALERVGACLQRAEPWRTGVALGLQPHAPNTVSLAGYRRAIDLARRLGLPLATHLAETPEEREFIAGGTGPQRAMLERFGLWEDRILDQVGHGRTPIEHLLGVLASEPFLVAHVNDTGPDPGRALDTLADVRASVVYCPRASEYFGAQEVFGPHRYRDMLAAGVNVCLGTDSIVNLPPGVDGPEGAGLSVLDEARTLFRRDRADPMMLVRMMTVHGCRALGLPPERCSLADGAEPAGLVAAALGQRGGEGSCAERLLSADGAVSLLAVNPPSAAW